MTETLVALILAHVLADFVFQSDWMVADKRDLRRLAAHGAVVLVTALAAMGSLDPWLFALAPVHLAIDAVKARFRAGLRPFLVDQAAHLVSLVALALWRPGLWDAGVWAHLPGLAGWPALAALPAVWLLVAGAILAVGAGGHAIGLMMAPFAAGLVAAAPPEAQPGAPPDTAPDTARGKTSPEGLPGAGRMIGHLERGLIFVLILIGQPEGVGLLIAAKSILRFGAVSADRALSEYVIIGTLASFGWAILAACATMAGLAALSPLGILPATP